MKLKLAGEFELQTPKICGCYFVRFSSFPHTRNKGIKKKKTKKTSCCDSKFAMKHMLERDWKSDFPLFIYDDQKHMFVNFLIGCRGPPSYAHYQV